MPVLGDGLGAIHQYGHLFVIDVAFVGQENVKTKHPQLHYESKLYMLLQGGSKLMPMEPIQTHSRKPELWNCPCFVISCHVRDDLS
jgi:hypothetical protein